ncbi:hypothetical protein PRIPAC_80750 [Pristionchus pacificus]|uniref:Uncharacterized protein n=1 Tax=Pristionchus pacificus TaxID=54126 RepID=A0A2A6BHU3_PRIPA|nr:hypothetical protein PRIPAC_80750 [Pristionchus pacificus]|eukprot:PDM65381.1 hypothetical protein PRIPAC_52323 [Pristionchus pacificus]
MLPSTDALGYPIPPERPSRRIQAPTPAPCTCAACPAHGTAPHAAHLSAPLGSAPSGGGGASRPSHSRPPFVAILSLLDELTTTTTAPNGDQERRIGGVRVSSVRDTAICAACAVGCYRMFLCCCWPVHKCATILSVFDTLIVSVFFYNVLKNVAKGHTDSDRLSELIHNDWMTVAGLMFCTAFLVCQLIGTVFICMAPKKKIAHYCWPRLVLITGLLICGVIALVVMCLYFSGKSLAMNNALFAVYEFFFDDKMSQADRQHVSKDLKIYAGAFFALIIVFVLYTLFELLLLRKMYNELKKGEFHPVSTQEPSAPPAFNPEFGAGKA